MTESKRLKSLGIYNDYAIAERGDKIFITYAMNGGRSCLPSWWSVHLTDKAFKGAWYCQGAKTFSGKMKSPAFMEALVFASKIVNCNVWVKTPFGGYISQNTADKLNLKSKVVINLTEGKHE
jgi:hypothetical protein